jgi:arylsulfatase A-like enzyme
MVEKVGEFLESRSTDRPLFLHVNFQDTHFPYHHRFIKPLVSDVVLPQARIAPGEQDALRSMYLNSAANVDRAIGDVLDAARRTLGHDPAVIVLSDHGESLYDQGFLGHGYALNEVQTRIPLIAAGIPLKLEEPFAQADLRDAIAAALEHGTAADMQPHATDAPSRQIFQYLGLLRRPVQIAFTSLKGRIVYDFRERRARIHDGPWLTLEELAVPEREQVLRLIQTWERMMLARAADDAS